MGLEARCHALFRGRRSEGVARLEDKDLVFRGEFRLNVPLRHVKSAEARGGTLTVDGPFGRASFELGSQAEKWALKIRYPRGLMDKLGVKPGLRVSVVGLDEPWFWSELEERGAEVARGRLAKGSDLVFAGMAAQSDLARLSALRDAIEPDGAVWVIWPKGRKTFREDDVRAAGPLVGLVDVKVVSVSETLSALKMVIPVALRKKAPASPASASSSAPASASQRSSAARVSSSPSRRRPRH
jgi:hypothetical protein